MSTRGSRGSLKGYVRNQQRRRMVLDVDLNVPPREQQEEEGTSAQAGQQGGSVPPAPIDVEAFDDDVIISSPRAFAEAKNNSRRNRGRATVVDIDSEERTSRSTFNNHNKRRRVPSTNQTIINCDFYINLEGTNHSMNRKVQKVAAVPPPPPPPPPPPTFSCPVCMGPLVEEMTTKCGHIFCKTCIKAAISAQSKCPTCRRKITNRDTFRVYLPTTN